MEAMKKGADALKAIHGSLYVPLTPSSLPAHRTPFRSIDKVDTTMDSIREQMELTNEISDAISNPMNIGIETNDEELRKELEELEQEKLDEVLMGADRVPSHVPVAAGMAAQCECFFIEWVGAGWLMVLVAQKQYEKETDEERELRELEASLAM